MKRDKERIITRDTEIVLAVKFEPLKASDERSEREASRPKDFNLGYDHKGSVTVWDNWTGSIILHETNIAVVNKLATYITVNYSKKCSKVIVTSHSSVSQSARLIAVNNDWIPRLTYQLKLRLANVMHAPDVICR